MYIQKIRKTMEEFDLNQQLVRHLKSHAVWLGRIARRDDQLAGPCMVLWEELKTGLFLSSELDLKGRPTVAERSKASVFLDRGGGGRGFESRRRQFTKKSFLVQIRRGSNVSLSVF